MLIRIVKDWQYPPNFFSQTPHASGEWNGMKFTEEAVDSCDYLIVLQRPPVDIDVTCPSGNAWLVTQEPPVPYFKFYSKSFRYFDRVYSYSTNITHSRLQPLQPVLPWHIFKSYDELVALTRNHLHGKKDALTWITSNKKGFAGQILRMDFLRYLTDKDFKFNLYGSGFKTISDKFDGLFPVKYSLAIENYSTPHYWTEKLADSLLSWCLPFYWGASNLEDYFPPDSFIRIDISKPDEALQIIQDAMNNNEWEKRLSAIETARELILNEYQFFPYISHMIEEDCKARPKTIKKRYFIPKNPYPFRYLVWNQILYYTRRILNLFKQ